MIDNDTPDPEDHGLTVEEVPRSVEHLLEESDPAAQAGRYHVRLLIPVDEASDPVDAVEQFIYDITNFGLRSYLYRVIDIDTDEAFYVQSGRVVTEEEALSALDDEG